ncbi:GNAT family N-acetyltransferase [Vibrio sp. Of7-15]|uniref:GNAT family N-acetyltransferase n=1 Tax=Vibrio sp. Of7-15 TaxID=2724879 RepID=UPI001EF18D5A|nr:GNAT family N-acetyltransferase [Vibrio sp. Of7-15]MCG7495310.1 GNAT family N-acetyltransferase [Vibrio sp. Of7-15]
MDLQQRQEMFELYNYYERKQCHMKGFEAKLTCGVTRYVSNTKDANFITYHNFSNDDDLAEIIQSQVDAYKKEGKNFEWKVFDTDKPSTLGRYLMDAGFEPGEDEAFMVLDLDSASENLYKKPKHIRIERVRDPERLNVAFGVQEQVWNQDRSEHAKQLAQQMREQPKSLAVYIAYYGDVPACSAWINFNGDSPFSGLWAGSTLEAYRGKGLYRSLLAARAREAKRRGIRYLTIDASPMSRPIVEQFGFEFITYTRPYEMRHC